MGQYTDTVLAIRRGLAANYIDEQLERLLREIEATGKAGSINVKLTFTPEKGDDNAAKVTPSVTLNMPKRDLPSGMVFIADGKADRTDPRQLEMMKDDKVIDLQANQSTG